MTAAEFHYCTTCGRDTLHSVNRGGSGETLSLVCKDPDHCVRLAAASILRTLQRGSIEATEIPSHPVLRTYARPVLVAATQLLEDSGQIIVLRETSDGENPYPFSTLMLNSS
jgi:hypothetical protein